MSRTTITHPDGTVTTVVTRTGSGQGCSWVFWAALVVFVVATPATEFPLGGAIVAYIVEAAILAMAVCGWVTRQRAKGPMA